MKGMNGYENFESHEEKIDAVILNLEQIGETARKLSYHTKDFYSSVNWPQIIGLRNMISHEYEGIRLNIIYEIATQHIPQLLSNLENASSI